MNLSFFAKAVNLLPAFLRPIIKAVLAAVLPLVSVSLLNGSFDYKAIIAAALTAVAVYVFPNQSEPQPLSVPVAAPPRK